MSSKDEVPKQLQELANQLKAVSNTLQSLANTLAEGKPVTDTGKANIEEQLKTELGENTQYVDLSASSYEIRIRPKKFLETEIFKNIADISRKHGGRWDGGQRCFIIQRK